MVTLATVEAQLKAVGCQFRFWGRSELRELCQILLPGEKIAQAVNGQYDAGFAMLVSTDFRILLIDKKPKYLTLKDIRYDMITELDFSGRMMNSSIRIYTPNKELRFTTTSAKKLRTLYNHSQHKVMEIRHRFMMQQFAVQHQVQNTPPGMAMLQQQYGQSFLDGFNAPNMGMGPSGMPAGYIDTLNMPQSTEEQLAFQAPEVRHQVAYQAAQQESDQQASYPLNDNGSVGVMPEEKDRPDESGDSSGFTSPGSFAAGSSDDTLSGSMSAAAAKAAEVTKQRLLAAMGHAGLRSLVHNGQIIREYMTVPFQQRWRKRPYGYRRESFTHSPQL